MQHPLNKLLSVLRLALLAAVLWFVARHVAANWQSVDGIPPVNVAFLLAACLLVWYGYAVRCVGFQAILRAHGHRVPFVRTIGLVYVPLLGKYIPGKIWSLVSALHFYSREGIPKHITLACISLTMVVSLLSALAVVAAFGSPILAERVGWLPALMATSVLLVATSPRVFYAFTNAGLRFVNRPQIEAKITGANVFRVLLLYSLATLAMAVGFVLLAAAFYPVDLSDAPSIIAIFTLAQVVGFLAIFAPGGIGVREGILIAGLQPLIGAGPAIVVTGIARLWQTVLELITAGVGWLMLRESTRKSEGQQTKISQTCEFHNEGLEDSGADARIAGSKFVVECHLEASE